MYIDLGPDKLRNEPEGTSEHSTDLDSTDIKVITPKHVIRWLIAILGVGILVAAFMCRLWDMLDNSKDKYVEKYVSEMNTPEPATQNSIEVAVPSEEPFPTEIIIENCPFCGSKGEIRYLDEGLAWGECQECDVSTEHYCCVTSQEAVMQALKAWNRRPETDD